MIKVYIPVPPNLDQQEREDFYGYILSELLGGKCDNEDCVVVEVPWKGTEDEYPYYVGDNGFIIEYEGGRREIVDGLHAFTIADLAFSTARAGKGFLDDDKIDYIIFKKYFMPKFRIVPTK